ncbi:MAG: hypothetical protein IPK82_14740 [Polyangiaceae bacterium]|nr:hypothetical protein [Polyangiaceae bacterium]
MNQGSFLSGSIGTWTLVSLLNGLGCGPNVAVANDCVLDPSVDCTPDETGLETGGGGQMCTPDTSQICYGGAPETLNVGACVSGVQTCGEDHLWGDCWGAVLPGTEDCSIAANEDCNWGVGCSETDWSHVFGDSDVQCLSAVAFDSEGAMVAVGRFNGKVNFGRDGLVSQGEDVFVVKFDRWGKHLWSRRIGDGHSQAATSVAVDSQNNVVVAGRFKGEIQIGNKVLSAASECDAYVAKFAPSGEYVWARRFGGAGVYHTVQGLSISADNELVVAGQLDGVLNVDGYLASSVGEQDMFLATPHSDGSAKCADS